MKKYHQLDSVDIFNDTFVYKLKNQYGITTVESLYGQLISNSIEINNIILDIKLEMSSEQLVLTCEKILGSTTIEKIKRSKNWIGSTGLIISSDKEESDE